MLKHNHATIGTASCVAIMMAGATTTAMAQTSSLEDIAKQAMATHPAVLARQMSSQAAGAELEGASWQRYPSPNVELNTDSNGVSTTLFRLQQPLWTGGRITAGIDAAQSRQQASESAVKEAKQDLVLRVIAAFVEALRQRARLEAVAQSVQQHESLLGMITRRVDQEASPRVDLELAQSRLLQASNDLSSGLQAQRNALTQLSQLAGRPVRTVGFLEIDSLLGQQSIESLLEQAITVSPTLRRLDQEIDAAQADADLKRASYHPQISLRLENAHASASLNGISAYSTNRVFLVAEFQPGAGLSAASGVAAAIAKRDAARQQRDTAMRDLQERVSIDWEELVAASKRLENATLASKSSKEVYESYSRQYTTGRKSWLDVLNSVREFTQSDQAVADSRAQASGASLRLRLATANLKGLSE